MPDHVFSCSCRQKAPFPFLFPPSIFPCAWSWHSFSKGTLQLELSLVFSVSISLCWAYGKALRVTESDRNGQYRPTSRQGVRTSHPGAAGLEWNAGNSSCFSLTLHEIWFTTSRKTGCWWDGSKYGTPCTYEETFSYTLQERRCLNLHRLMFRYFDLSRYTTGDLYCHEHLGRNKIIRTGCCFVLRWPKLRQSGYCGERNQVIRLPVRTYEYIGHSALPRGIDPNCSIHLKSELPQEFFQSGEDTWRKGGGNLSFFLSWGFT